MSIFLIFIFLLPVVHVYVEIVKKILKMAY